LRSWRHEAILHLNTAAQPRAGADGAGDTNARRG
jgi:hypothetical protein